MSRPLQSSRPLPLFLLTLLSLLTLAAPALADHEHRGSPPVPYGDDQIVIDRDDLERQTVRQQRRMTRNLRQMQALADQLPPCSVRDELLQTIARSQRLLDRMAETDRALVAMATVAPPPQWEERPGRWEERPPRWNEPRRPVPVSDAELGDLLRALDDEPFDSGKRALLSDIARHRWFTARQAKRLVQEFTFSDAKVEAAALLHRRVVDPQDFYVVYDALTFRSDKDELRRRIGAG